MEDIKLFRQSVEYNGIRSAIKRVSEQSTGPISQHYGYLPQHLTIKNPCQRGNAERGITLKQGFDAGDVIYDFLPKIEVAETNQSSESADSKDNLCAHCLKSLNISKMGVECGGCDGFVKYCCEQCMDADLAVHKIECLFMNSFDSEERNKISCVERLILRLIITLGSDDTLVRQCQDLTSHHEVYLEAKKNQDFSNLSPSHQSLFEVTEAYSLGFLRFFGCHLRGLIKLCFVVFVNSTVLQNYYDEPIGIMFDPFFSLINHSCEPNTILVWKGRRAALKALKKLQPGEELLVSYCPVFMPKSERKRQLQNSFFFDCGCCTCTLGYDLWFPGNTLTGGMEWETDTFDGRMVDGTETERTAYLSLMKGLRDVYCPEEKKGAKIMHNIATSFRQLETPEKSNLATLVYKNVQLVPRHSWPMYKIMSLMKANTTNDPVANLRFTVLTIDIENAIEQHLDYKASLGMGLYELSVCLLKVIKAKRRQEVDWNLDMLVDSALALALQAHKQLKTKFGSSLLPPLADLKNVVSDLRSLKSIDIINEATAGQQLEELSQLLQCGVNLLSFCEPLTPRDVTDFNLILESGPVSAKPINSNFSWLLQI
ncbi:hypothetical protein KL918_002620 [Ogataea parapolymorpha]|uniref:SET domain-containing protein n=1 Tax=Ogataea parapolymorpha (strain ATCC 26012 / BCRC 20466 / JCM 22074 / NRRL Y-7560 / DL-1) TaxID=871575 RepID=W1QH96_OGAPD|nr:hypothetical protein HPODL_00389 [Ogataea parapolymorpha DL-1]ESX00975.1 hypothetical protein HPODL_00389 [Ogataea parapolymorpha DL-1]KAG7867181.1 hypothetical protein KL918_002620 [Ogataea parapolymorpha]KAG7870881.1 hypothetical protein KL916_004612 [Ogataea parapolymorpha]